MKGANLKMSDSKHKKEILAQYLRKTINAEINKPYTEIDHDLIDASVELILELQGRNFALSNDDVCALVSKIPFGVANETDNEQTVRKKPKKKKLFLIAATISLLCALLLVVSQGNDNSLLDMIKSRFGSVSDVPENEPIHYGNLDFVHYGDSLYYKDAGEFFANEDLNVLIPSDLPDGINLTDILVVNSTDSVIVSFDSVITSYAIQLERNIPQEVTETATRHTAENGLEYYVTRLEETELIQIYFSHSGNSYCVCGSDEQLLLDIINNLEEYE